MKVYGFECVNRMYTDIQQNLRVTFISKDGSIFQIIIAENPDRFSGLFIIHSYTFVYVSSAIV